MEDIVQIKLFDKDGYIETIEMDLCTYYDGDDYGELIDPENIVKKGVVRVEVVQYDGGKLYSEWWVNFDENGNQTNSGQRDIEDGMPD